MTYYSVTDTRPLYSDGTALIRASTTQTATTLTYVAAPFVVAESINIGGLVFVVATDSPESKAMLRDRAWAEFDALFQKLDASAQIINDLDDEKLSHLRSRWSKRLRSLYEPDIRE
jgi:hypothetical protein